MLFTFYHQCNHTLYIYFNLNSLTILTSPQIFCYSSIHHHNIFTLFHHKLYPNFRSTNEYTRQLYQLSHKNPSMSAYIHIYINIYKKLYMCIYLCDFFFFFTRPCVSAISTVHNRVHKMHESRPRDVRERLTSDFFFFFVFFFPSFFYYYFFPFSIFIYSNIVHIYIYIYMYTHGESPYTVFYMYALRVKIVR